MIQEQLGISVYKHIDHHLRQFKRLIMLKNLKQYCQKLIAFSENELNLIDDYFEIKTLKKKDFLLQDNAVCDFIAFISEGSIRHFHVKNGNETDMLHGEISHLYPQHDVPHCFRCI